MRNQVKKTKIHLNVDGMLIFLVDEHFLETRIVDQDWNGFGYGAAPGGEEIDACAKAVRVRLQFDVSVFWDVNFLVIEKQTPHSEA